MKKGKTDPDTVRKCFDCEHYHACSMWTNGTLQNTIATNCANYDPSMVLVRLELDQAKARIRELEALK